jgi:hypothetical protein
MLALSLARDRVLRLHLRLRAWRLDVCARLSSADRTTVDGLVEGALAAGANHPFDALLMRSPTVRAVAPSTARPPSPPSSTGDSQWRSESGRASALRPRRSSAASRTRRTDKSSRLPLGVCRVWLVIWCGLWWRHGWMHEMPARTHPHTAATNHRHHGNNSGIVGSSGDVDAKRRRMHWTRVDRASRAHRARREVAVGARGCLHSATPQPFYFLFC